MEQNSKTIHNKDHFFMQKALSLAQKAYSKKEVPIGAIVVLNKHIKNTGAEYPNQQSIIIGSGYNQVETYNSQLYHAEVIALNEATRYIEDWRLENCTIYVTVQPCMMCLGYIGLSRVERIVYGANSPLFGYPLDNGNIPLLYRRHIKDITSGVMAREVSNILKKFFKKRRECE